MSSRNRCVFAAISAAVLTTGPLINPVSASVISFYTSRSTFNAAAGGTPALTTFTFGSLSPNKYVNNVNPLPAVDGITFTDSSGFEQVLSGGDFSSNYLGENVPTLTETVNFSLVPGTKAFGFDASAIYQGTDADAFVLNAAGSSGSNAALVQGTAFIGFVSSTPVTTASVTFTETGPSGQGGYALDNVTFGTTAVPEPASLSLLGVAALGQLRRRSRRVV